MQLRKRTRMRIVGNEKKKEKKNYQKRDYSPNTLHTKTQLLVILKEKRKKKKQKNYICRLVPQSKSCWGSLFFLSVFCLEIVFWKTVEQFHYHLHTFSVFSHFGYTGSISKALLGRSTEWMKRKMFGYMLCLDFSWKKRTPNTECWMSNEWKPVSTKL